jgi:mono/diheme cytochrome c family protein
MTLFLGAGAAADDASFTPVEAVARWSGAQIYDHICQGCHMAGAQGAVGAGHYPKLAGDRALVSWQYAALTVLNGKNGMPAFGAETAGAGPMQGVHLSDAQIADVVNYVRNNFGNRYRSKVTAPDVAALPHAAAAPMP